MGGGLVSLDAQDWVWNHSKSKGVGRLVMLALADKAKPAEGECKAYGSQRWLAERANCKQEAVTEALPVLYDLGELEIVEGEKGPYGATMYRLPKAIGYERAASNRSAHPVDSNGKTPKKSTGSPGHPATGSPGRSEPGSTGSPGHNTTSHQSTTTEAPEPPPSPNPPGGGGGALGEAHAFLEALPTPWTAGRVTARQLAPLLAEAAQAQGWCFDDALLRQLTRNPNGISNFAAVLKRRIEDLPKKPTEQQRTGQPTGPRPMPPWCGDLDCDEETRLRYGTVNGLPYSGPCHCHPDHQKGAA